MVELKRKHFWDKVRNRCSLKKCFGIDTVGEIWSDLAALMKVERWFELSGEPEGREWSLDEPEQWPRHPPQGKKCRAQKKKMFCKKCIPFNIALAVKRKAQW